MVLPVGDWQCLDNYCRELYKGQASCPRTHISSKSSEAKMKFLLLVALGLVALSAARPSDDIVDFELDNHEQEQEGQAGRAVKGEYSWTAPNGNEYFVKYEADQFGYRVVDDNVVPRALEGGQQDDDDDDDGDDN
ncbi:uncharacterized protein [Macrobrachium rosenbergii]|uniref:uncharacterized protein n=1 Tax=Macrobrachium rosenbergii TaxID=79674 RepID=UPI0034D5EBF2